MIFIFFWYKGIHDFIRLKCDFGPLTKNDNNFAPLTLQNIAKRKKKIAILALYFKKYALLNPYLLKLCNFGPLF